MTKKDAQDDDTRDDIDQDDDARDDIDQGETESGDDWRSTRRAVVATVVAGAPLAVAVSPVGQYLERVAPLSGAAWKRTGDGPDAVQNPYGAATVTYDDHHTPLVEADDERAAYFALGYVHASDRLFQMDVVRRQARGTLAAVVGAPAVERDVFFRQLDLVGAAAASRRALDGTEAGRVIEAYAEGVDTYVQSAPPGTEFGLLGYEPDPWTALDTYLVMARFAWQLSGQFDGLRKSITRRAFDRERHETLYPDRFDHDAPILRDSPERPGVDPLATEDPPGESVDESLVDWLGKFEPPQYVGSNTWTVSGEYTDSGAPIVASDPHMDLRVPPPLYEQQVSVEGSTVSGVTAAGLPFVVIGRNDHGAWGATRAGNVDVVDTYTYESDGDRYRYRGEWREFDAETETVSVARGEDRDVEVRKTVHGPLVSRDVGGEQRHVGVAWTFLTGTRELQALYEMGHSSGADEFEAALEAFDGVPLNVHYADTDGETAYVLTGKIPVRRIDGDPVPSDRIFDGSAGEGEWAGFEPYGKSTWDGFVPPGDKPSVRNGGYVASANQKFAAEPRYRFAGQGSQGYRAERIYELLDEAAGSSEPIDRATVEDIQLDTLDLRARTLVPQIFEARDEMPDRAEPWLDALESWDYRMDPDSRAALVFAHFLRAYGFLAWRQFFEEYDLGPRYWPKLRVLFELPADSEVFGGNRAGIMASAMELAIDQIEEAGWETYGDFNAIAITHLLGSLEPGLDYPRHPTGGSGRTIRATGPGGFGSSYRMVADLGGTTRTVLPGGNDGNYGSEHYHDQLETWANGEYTELEETRTGDPDLAFEEADR